MHFTRAALEWLETVLEERYGLTLVVTETEQEIILRLPGAEGCIRFDTLQPEFHRSSSDFPCGRWDAIAEGFRSALGEALPTPALAALPPRMIEQQGQNDIVIHYDILGLTYWMLNRIEEIGRTDLDHHGRFPATASHAYKHNYLERPVVDEWLHVLGQVISKTWPGLELKQHTFSIKVSHDVDAPSRYGFASGRGLLRAMAGDVLKRGDFKNPMRAPWIRLNSRKKIHPTDPFNTFEWIMDISDRHGLTSAFYFICGRTSNLDADYEPEHRAIRALMYRIHQRGHEIGLHPSFDTYQNPQAIIAEAARLRKIMEEEDINQQELGGRMHYLRWEHPTTMLGWEQASMTYDSSQGYADRPGFRSGTCFEYPAFDPLEGRSLKLRIRPLVAMECTVMARRYMGLGVAEASFDKFDELKQRCKAVQGCFTLLWHNSQLSSSKERLLYERVLRS